MPTYTFRCGACGFTQSFVMSMGDYVRHRPDPKCHGYMDRYFDAAPGLGTVSEDHYAGLRAPDGTDISSRAKHRAYMKAHNLTTADDFTETWKRAAQERIARLEGTDPTRAADVERAIEKLGGERHG